MSTIVSRTGMSVAIVAAALSAMCGLFVAYGYPWLTVAWAALAVAAIVWVGRATSAHTPRMTDVIDDVEAEPQKARVTGQPRRMSSAVAVGAATVVRITKEAMVELPHREPVFAEQFTAYLLSRNVRFEEDLIDQLFNSSEQRLARLLLLLAHFGKDSRPEVVIPRLSQETLASMVGTTRSRVSHFMNRFREMGFIDYAGGSGELRVHSGLLNVVLRD